MKTETTPYRNHAHPLDLKLLLESEMRGYDPSSDAIGGFLGISWEEYYEDRHTGATYSVCCSDGVNGGRGPYSNEDERLLESTWQWLRKQLVREAEELPDGQIVISRAEAVLLSKRVSIFDRGVYSIRRVLLSNRSGGAPESNPLPLGTINGVPVVLNDSAPPRSRVTEAWPEKEE